METTNEALRGWSCLNHAAGGGGSSGSTAVSLVVSGVDWAVLTINIICLFSSYT